MRKNLIITVLLLLSIPMAAQHFSPESLISSIDSGSVSLNYSFKQIDGVLSGEGTALIQSLSYDISTGSMRIVSDGKTRWTIDQEAKEVYVESSEDSSDLLSDMRQILKHLSDLKTGQGRLEGSFNIPDSDESFRFVFTEIKILPLEAEGRFYVDINELDSSYLVTDLRAF